jgi:hypothetical protein
VTRLLCDIHVRLVANSLRSMCFVTVRRPQSNKLYFRGIVRLRLSSAFLMRETELELPRRGVAFSVYASGGGGGGVGKKRVTLIL